MAAALPEANAFVIAPPAVPGLGTGNGFTMMIQATGGQSYHALEQATGAMIGAAAQEKEVQQVFSLFYRSEEHTSELQSLMRISYAVFCLKKKTRMQYRH